MHECVFCDQRRISGAFTPASADDVRQAYAGLLGFEETPAELAFYGGSFTAIPTQQQVKLLEAASQFLAQSPKNSIRVSTRPDCIDNRIVEMLRKHGVATIEIGAQSMCDEVLAKSRRGHTAADVSSSAKCIKDAGLKLILQMMTGLPGDTHEKAVETAKQFIAMQPDGVRIYPAVIVRGTELHEMWKRGEYAEHTVEEAVGICAVLCEMFENAGIPVIRLGLNVTESLSYGGAVAGAFHQSFGELVRSSLYLNKAITLLEDTPPGSDITLGVARGCISKMSGHRRHNADLLTQRFGLNSLKIVQCGIKPGEVVKISRNPIDIEADKEYN
jgi:histone acetyltransferase (RNA polymerase elongator complex component)